AGFIGESNRVAGTLVSADDAARCSVRAGDALIHGTPAVALSPGAAVVLSLRPEQLWLDPDPAGCANLAEAVVEALTYLGDHTRVRLAFWGRDDWIAKLSAEHDRPGLAPGARIRVGFRAADARVFASTD
ncbi:MAG TPA: TOBE domain-containing protein, partial [Candidatus Sulfotelmatobacter sp.]|nr:TOBE domain-containing protein [Candidatus Sulfotelmatobacter sp.]